MKRRLPRLLLLCVMLWKQERGGTGGALGCTLAAKGRRLARLRPRLGRISMLRQLRVIHVVNRALSLALRREWERGCQGCCRAGGVFGVRFVRKGCARHGLLWLCVRRFIQPGGCVSMCRAGNLKLAQVLVGIKGQVWLSGGLSLKLGWCVLSDGA